VGALVAGWFVIPMVQYAIAPLAAAGTSASEAAPSLVSGTGLEILLLAVASLTGAVTQEIIHRGLLWQRLAEATGHTWVALVGTSLVFGLGFYIITRRLSAVVLLNALNMFLTYAVVFRYLI